MYISPDGAQLDTVRHAACMIHSDSESQIAMFRCDGLCDSDCERFSHRFQHIPTVFIKTTVATGLDQWSIAGGREDNATDSLDGKHPDDRSRRHDPNQGTVQ